MPDFACRAETPELMDSADVAFDDYRDCLRDLERVNVVTVAYRPTLAWLDMLLRDGRLPPDRAVGIVDVGCGHGDMLRRIARWARRREVKVDLVGLDRDPRSARAAAYAAGAAAARPGNIRYVTADLFGWTPEAPVDLIVSSLFAHHLDDGEVVAFLRWMERTAASGWFVNDLHRHPVPYHGFRLWSRLAGWHRFVRHDGPVSITRAFTRADWRRFLDAAGLTEDDVRIAWWMPFRLCVSRVRRP